MWLAFPSFTCYYLLSWHLRSGEGDDGAGKGSHIMMMMWYRAKAANPSLSLYYLGRRGRQGEGLPGGTFVAERKLFQMNMRRRVATSWEEELARRHHHPPPLLATLSYGVWVPSDSRARVRVWSRTREPTGGCEPLEALPHGNGGAEAATVAADTVPPLGEATNSSRLPRWPPRFTRSSSHSVEVDFLFDHGLLRACAPEESRFRAG